MHVSQYNPFPLIRRCLAVSLVLALSALQADAAHNTATRKVFLTFDDGPINITLDILDVLKAEDIKATFFINAIHLDGKGGEREDRAKEALRRLAAEGHVIGNHGYDHMAHNRAPGVYAMTAAQAYRDVETEAPYFLAMNIAPVNAVLGDLAASPNNRIAALARLPFANVWMFPHLSTLCAWCGTSEGAFWHPDARARAEIEVSQFGNKCRVG